jgi:hypothetical protein
MTGEPDVAAGWDFWWGHHCFSAWLRLPLRTN